mgnify:CR=1 FL=1
MKAVLKYSARNVYKKLQLKGIILRNVEIGYKIKNRLRLTIGTSRENITFMEAMRKII